MAYSYTAASLIQDVRDRAFLPVSGGASDAELLRFINREQLSYVVPILMGIGDEFFVAQRETTLTANEETTDIPSNSIGSKVRNVQISIDSGTTWYNLTHSEPERGPMYTNDQVNGNPGAYFIRANEIFLLPPPSGAWLLRLDYYRRPDAIVAASGYSALSNWSGPSGGNYTATVAANTTFATGRFNLIDSTTYEVLVEDVMGTVASSTSITFASSGLTAAEIALFSARASAGTGLVIQYGNTPAAQLPDEAANLLSQRAAAMFLMSKADPKAPLAMQECDRMKGVLTKLLAPRAAGLPRKIVGRQGPGWGAGAFVRWWRGA